MTSFFEALAFNPLLLTAVLAGFAASIISGVMGSYVVVKRIAFISGSIAHSVLGGIGLSLWLQRVQGITWISPIYGALGAAVLSAAVIGWIRLNYREREDTIIAALWSIGMATGVIFISQTPGFNAELMNFLLGNILWVSHTDLLLLIGLNIVTLTTVFLLHKRFLAICFDEQYARLQGVQVNTFYLLLLILIAITVVFLIQIVGIILVIAMLTIPPTIANMITSRLSRMMIIAVILNILFTFFGTASAYHLDWPTGATITLLAGFSYLLGLLFLRKS